jgi:hypothetical protein
MVRIAEKKEVHSALDARLLSKYTESIDQGPFSETGESRAQVERFVVPTFHTW